VVPTITSRLPALIDYLVNLFTNDVTLGQANPPVKVFDGPVTTLDPALLQLYVGLSDPENITDAEPAGETTQDWASFGRRARDEITTIHCAALAWAGTDDAKSMRVAATGIVAAVETLMQADTTSFGGNVLFPMAGVTNLALTQSNREGSHATVAFDLIFKSRTGGF
jgi:hypothetical protein